MNYLIQAKLAMGMRQSGMLIVSDHEKAKDEIEMASQGKTQAVLCLLLF